MADLLLAPASPESTPPPAAISQEPGALVWPSIRKGPQLVLLACGLFFCLSFVSWFGLLGELEVSIGAQPISIELHGLPSADRDRLIVTYQTTSADAYGDEQEFGFTIPREAVMFPDSSRANWRIARVWVKALHITAPSAVIASLSSIDVRIADRLQTFTQGDLASWPRLAQPLGPHATSQQLTGLLPNRSQPAITIEIPEKSNSAAPALNVRELPELAKQFIAFPFAGLGAAIAFSWLLVRFARSRYGVRCWTATIADITSAPSSRPFSGLWQWAGFGLSAAGIAALYARFSYPFTQDDNFSQFLPIVLYNCRSLLDGHWPAWNPHQFLGAPVATLGIYSVTYPPLYLAYGIARLAAHEYWTIEIYTLLHLAAGYALLTAFLRRLNVRPSLAALAASSFVLSGWFLIAGRTQMTFAPLAVWPVAMAWSLHQLVTSRTITWRWTALTGLAIGLFLHSGHSQLWVYGLMFYSAGLAFYWLAGRIDWRRLVQTIPAFLIGAGIAAPVLILQAIEGTESARSGSYGDRIDLLHMLLPLGSLWPRPTTLGSNGQQYFCEMYYSGTLFQVLCFVAILLAVARFVLSTGGLTGFRRLLGSNVWIALFLLAFIFGLGSKGILWTAFSQFPIFDRFRWPIKMEYFCLLYSTIGGAVVAERWFAHRPRVQYPVIGGVICLLLFHVSLCQTSWYDFADRPYPTLPAFIAARVLNPEGRLLTRWESMDRSPAAGYYQVLPLDLATQAGAYAIGGYDTFVEGSLPARRAKYKFWIDPLAAARAYGVKWAVSSPTFDQPVSSENPVFWALEVPSVNNLLAIHAVQDSGRLVDTAAGVSLYELSGFDPLAFVTRQKQALPIQLNSGGARIDTNLAQPGDTVVCNFVMRPWITATASSGQILKAEADEWGRIRVRLPQQSAFITISYSPPWTKTVLAGLLLLVGGGFGFAMARKLEPPNPEQAQSDRQYGPPTRFWNRRE